MTKLLAIRRGRLGFAILILPAILAAPAYANNYGESYGWQFHTSADRANQAILLDFTEKRRGGFYQAPRYTTTIERQYNCGVTATSVGNEGSQSAIANAPSVAGATADAKGNAGETVLNGGVAGRASNRQTNTGDVSSGVTGDTIVSVTGQPHQSLDATQTNGGRQSADISGSQACAFGGER